MGDRTVPQERCPQCCAAVRPGAPWCTQCFAPVGPAVDGPGQEDRTALRDGRAPVPGTVLRAVPAPRTPAGAAAPPTADDVPREPAGAAAAPTAAVVPTASADLPAPPPPPSAAPPPPAPPADGASWPCDACGSRTPLADAVCGTCGAAFLELARGSRPALVLPLLGDVTALSTVRLVALGLALVTALLLAGLVAGALLT